MKHLKSILFLSFLFNGIMCWAQFPIVLEAEGAKLYGDLTISTVSGFSGNKYVHNFHINSDSYFLYENVEVTQAGTYEFRIYSTGTSRPLSIKVNNYERTIVWTTDSPDWNAPPTSSSSTYIYLDKGINIIKIATEFENGPNIDKFEIHRTNVNTGQPPTVKEAFPYDFTDEAVVTAEHPNESLAFLTDNDENTFYEVAGVTSTTITLDCKENKLITSILLASERGVDVTEWKIEYSTDGSNWRSLSPSSVRIIGMGNLTLFTYNRTSSQGRVYAARYYRLTATGTGTIKIAEWQMFGIPFLSSSTPFPEDITESDTTTEQVTGYPDGRTNQKLINLFDRKMQTKYCDDSREFYVQYILDKAYNITSYSITSADDSPERDPKLWSFSGYNPEEGWIELDERRDFKFPGRHVTMQFDIDSDKEFTAFMLEVSSIKAGTMVQLNNLQVFGESTGNPTVKPILPGQPSSDPKERASELVKLMTKSEKLAYVGGVDWMFTRAVPRLGIPQVKMSDGPQGVGTWGKSTAYPCNILLASTWNEDLAWSYGEALAMDSRARGVHILLGPGVNIHRAPMCGRNFEYMGEDPYLTSRTAVNYIKGLQENGVMAVIKHFAANYQEYNRNYISSDIDERTLNEIYFPAFRAAVQEANVGSVMSSYNLLNGTWTTHHPWLLHTVLREQWGFDGILMSDWGSTHNGLEAAIGGLDLEMASGDHMSPDTLRYHLNRGELDMSIIDEKVQNILQTIIRFGFMDNEQLDSTIPLDNPAAAQTALDVAREGIVLLKNKDNILPVASDKIKKIAVVGQNANRYLTGGGSGRIDPIRYVSFYEGIAALGAKKGIDVKFIDTNDHMDDVIYTGSGSEQKGFKGEFFNNTNLQGSPVATRIDNKIDFDFQNGPGLNGIGTSNYSIRWTGELRPEVSGEYTFSLGGDDGFRLYINDVKVIDDWNPGQERYKTHPQNLTAGEKYSIKIEYFQEGGGAMVDFYWTRSGADNYLLTSMNEADIVVACFGFDASTEAEGGDRSFELPSKQQELLNQVLKTQTPVIGIVSAGGNVEMQSWEPQLDGLLWAWYPGQEGGTALGEILFGDVNPSGKLPITFEKRWRDNPTYSSYYDTNNSKHVEFTEGVFVGYRGYDKLNREVQYPFGYGLSYTTFNLSDMTVSETSADNSILKVTARLKNTGEIAGAQVVQLYVGKKGKSKVERPLRELKAYKKVYLEPGETQLVTLDLSKDAFSYFDVDKTSFVLEEGEYELSLGFSSRDIQENREVFVDNSTSIEQESINFSGILIPTIVKSGEIIHIKIGTVSSVEVYNLTGSLVANHKNTDIIPTSGLIKGTYIASINGKDGLLKEKFTIK